MELLLIRHALPLRIEVESGRADPDLTDTGHDQARALAQWLATEQIDALYSSPLARARQTAAPISTVLGDPDPLEPVVDDDLAEWDRDAQLYIPTAELKATAHDLWQAMAAGRWDLLGIDVDAFRERVLRSIAAIAARHPGERVAVVCHGGVINVYAASVLGLDATLFFEPDYTSVTRVLVARSGERTIRSLNEVGHLRSPGSV